MKQPTRSLWLVCTWACLSVGCGLRPTASSSTGQSGKPESRDVEIVAGDTVPDSSALPEPVTAADAALNRVLSISFDDLQPERYKQPDADKLPREIEDLHGKRVRIRGYMLPSFEQTAISEFALVRDNMQCCFGAIVNPFDCIVVRMEAFQSIDYDIDPITVEGVFQLQEDDVNADFPAFYNIESAKVSY